MCIYALNLKILVFHEQYLRHQEKSKGHSHTSFKKEKKENSDIKRGKVSNGTRCVKQEMGWKEELGIYRE